MGWFNRFRHRSGRSPRGFLTRLGRDRSGNTLAIMAAAMVPLIGFSGSAIDMARLYVVKVRLQQACDAGVLAGRKTMTDVDPTTALDANATAQAQAFFTNNFRKGWFQNTGGNFTPAKTVQGSSTVANAVTATAKTTVPMTLMQFFGMAPVPLSVTCQAVSDFADADIVFVLDTTGSMSCYPSDPETCVNSPQAYTRADGTTGFQSPEKPKTTDSNGKDMYSKIESLRQAVVQFDTAMRANSDSSTHVRYSFVTYSSSVNVGRLLKAKGYLQNTNWTYQSRHVKSDYDYGTPILTAQNIGLSQTDCAKGGTVRLPATGYVSVNQGLWSNEGYAQARKYSNLAWSNGGCYATGQRVRPLWRYEPTTFDISGFINTSADTNTSVLNPTRFDGSKTSWRGCIEEVNTQALSSFSLSSLPDDLNPDFTPSDPTDMWRPSWQDVEWGRNLAGGEDVYDHLADESFSYKVGGTQDSSFWVSCGVPATRLAEMSAQNVYDYVHQKDFVAYGATYHDVGMIWGTRLLSPNSVFADSKPWPGRNDPNRIIVFMTDGAMGTYEQVYGQYGREQFDNRIGSNTSQDEQKRRHTARFRIECDAAKQRGITIYTVGLGLSTSTTDLDYCATEKKTYTTTTTADLKNIFTALAQRVAKLRINQ